MEARVCFRGQRPIVAFGRGARWLQSGPSRDAGFASTAPRSSRARLAPQLPLMPGVIAYRREVERSRLRRHFTRPPNARLVARAVAISAVAEDVGRSEKDGTLAWLAPARAPSDARAGGTADREVWIEAMSRPNSGSSVYTASRADVLDVDALDGPARRPGAARPVAEGLPDDAHDERGTLLVARADPRGRRHGVSSPRLGTLAGRTTRRGRVPPWLSVCFVRVLRPTSSSAPIWHAAPRQGPLEAVHGK